MIVDILGRFDPKPDVLLRAVSMHITDEMLDNISTADYGERADEHFTALRQVRDFPGKVALVPDGVRPTRWSASNLTEDYRIAK